MIPWDHDADIGYLEGDYGKVLAASYEVTRLKGFHMNSLIASYKNVTMDLFRWRKRRKHWTLSSIYNRLTLTPDTDDNFEMMVVMPRDFATVTYMRNIFVDNFPYKYIKTRSKVIIKDFEVYAPNDVKAFLQNRYYLTFNYIIPYCISKQ